MRSASTKFALSVLSPIGAADASRSTTVLDLGLELIVGEDPGDEADAEGFGGVELRGEHVELARPGRSDDPGERPRSAHVPGDAHLEECGVEPGRRRGEPEVARAGPTEPGSRAGPVHGGNRDRRHLMQEHGSAEVRRAQRFVGDRPARHRLQVGAWAERRSGAGEHEHPHALVLGRHRERVADLSHHPVRHRVLAVGTVHRDRHDRAVLLEEDRLERRVAHWCRCFHSRAVVCALVRVLVGVTAVV